MLVLCRPKLALCYSMWTLCWPQLPLSSPYFTPMFTYVGLSSLYLAPMLTLCSPMLAVEMLSPIAVTETTEVGTRWRRGGNGVGRGSPQAGAAAGGASLYNLRLPSEGLRQGHGRPVCWPAPGFKGWRLTAGRRPKGGYVGAMLVSLGPIWALCCPYVRLC